MELVSLLNQVRDFGVWPFEGRFAAILAQHRIAIAEIYPRVCYALALDDVLPAPLRKLSKGKQHARDGAVDALLMTEWMRALKITLAPAHAALARGDEDHFDAMISAVSLLRSVLEGRSLDRAGSYQIEGDILGIDLIDAMEVPNGDVGAEEAPRAEACLASLAPSPAAKASARLYRCPIRGCSHVFVGSRGGWDAHVASLPRHPRWHPDVSEPDRRKKFFRAEFPEFFRR